MENITGGLAILVTIITSGIIANFYTTRLAIRLAIQELKTETSQTYVCSTHCTERRAEAKDEFSRLEKKIDDHIHAQDTAKILETFHVNNKKGDSP